MLTMQLAPKTLVEILNEPGLFYANKYANNEDEG